MDDGYCMPRVQLCKRLSRGDDGCFGFHFPKTFKLLVFQLTLFQKRFGRTEFVIYVVICFLQDQHAKLDYCTVLAN